MLVNLNELCRLWLMIYRTLRSKSLIVTLALGLLPVSLPAQAQDAAWDGLINAGREALQRNEFTEAEGHFEQALETAEQFPPGDPRLGRSLNNLAAVYYSQKDYDRAGPLMRRSLSILEDSLGPENADVAQTKKNLAAIYYLQGNFDEAEPLLKEALSTLETLHGPDHAFVATVLNNLAALYQSQDRYVDAEPLLARSLTIWEALLGPEHEDVVKSRELLARLREANNQSSDDGATQQAAGADQSTGSAEAAIGPVAASQIIALAAEAEAAANEGLADTETLVNDPVPVPKADDGSDQVEQATRALADLTASETAAAARNTDDNEAPSASNETDESENSLPTPLVQTAALPPLEPAAGPSEPDFAIYLSTLWSEDEARRYWQALKEEVPDLLADKDMELEEVAYEQGGGSFYRVLTIPFESDPAAQEVCDAIRSQVRTHDCNVIAR